jgi:hypothetical protein
MSAIRSKGVPSRSILGPDYVGSGEQGAVLHDRDLVRHELEQVLVSCVDGEVIGFETRDQQPDQVVRFLSRNTNCPTPEVSQQPLALLHEKLDLLRANRVLVFVSLTALGLVVEVEQTPSRVAAVEAGDDLPRRGEARIGSRYSSTNSAIPSSQDGMNPSVVSIVLRVLRW